MKTIAQRIWNEPAVFIGALVTLGLVFLNVLGEDDWGVDNIIAVVAPLASALGIRQLVVPTGKAEELATAPPAGTRLATPEERK